MPAGAALKKVKAKCCDVFTDANPEVARLKRNWIIIYINMATVGLSFIIANPSLHQFITTPLNTTSTNNIKPGLGLNEVFYSWAVSVFNVGELVGALGAAFGTKYLSVKLLHVVASASGVIGSLMYGLTSAGWMVIVARMLQGIFFGSTITLMRLYIGETANIAVKLKQLDPEKSQIKNQAFFIAFSISTISVALGPGLSSFVSQFPSIDPFRWSGWLLCILCLFLTAVNALYFVEQPSDINRKGTRLSIRKLKPAVPVYVIICLVLFFIVLNFGFSMIEALLSPFLGDNFGLNIEFISYVFLGVSLVFFLSSIQIMVMQRFGLSNKFIFLIGIIAGIAGGVISSDWQSIYGDPCDKYSYNDFVTDTSLGNGSVEFYEKIDHGSIENFINNSSANCSLQQIECYFIAQCLAYSSPPDECFWNPNSRVSGIVCDECLKVCRSKDKSLNFVQLLIGVILYSGGFIIQRLSMTIMASDCMGTEGQSLLSGVMVASGAVSKIIGPLWGNSLFLVAKHRTYLPLSVLNVMMVLVLMAYLLIYRKLTPKSKGNIGLPSHNNLKTNDSTSMKTLVDAPDEEEEGEEDVELQENAKLQEGPSSTELHDLECNSETHF